MQTERLEGVNGSSAGLDESLMGALSKIGSEGRQPFTQIRSERRRRLLAEVRAECYPFTEVRTKSCVALFVFVGCDVIVLTFSKVRPERVRRTLSEIRPERLLQALAQVEAKRGGTALGLRQSVVAVVQIMPSLATEVGSEGGETSGTALRLFVGGG